MLTLGQSLPSIFKAGSDFLLRIVTLLYEVNFFFEERERERMNGGGDNAHFTITIIDHGAEKIMTERMQQMPRLLKSSAGNSACCIFRVPQSLVEINKEAYQPQIVSIGPYHHGKDNLKMMEEHKWRFLKEFLERADSTIGKYLSIVASLEDEIKKSYSEMIDYNSRDLVQMMVLDGFFIIELLCKVGRFASTSEDDPIFTIAWVLPFLMRDLIRLENQLPFFVLQKLFNESKSSRKDSCPSLQILILNFFNYVLARPNQVIEKCKLMEGKHILDFYRMGFTANKSSRPIVKKIGENLVLSPFLKVIPSATKLHISGVIFKPNLSSDTLLDIKFQNGQLEIPHITLDDFITVLFLNCVAFEQSYIHCSKDITAYVTFLGCLINTPTDSSFLCDHKIIEKYLGTDQDIAKFFNNVGKDVAFDIENNYLSGLFEDVNKYSMNGWHVVWAGFKHTYFDTPWSFISAFAALLLIILTFIQAFFAPLGYFHYRH